MFESLQQTRHIIQHSINIIARGQQNSSCSVGVKINF